MTADRMAAGTGAAKGRAAVSSNRRELVSGATKLLLVTSASTAALEALFAGTPERAKEYRELDHWWGMVIDIEKCIGCGNCVRACKTENDVPLEPFYFRTWVERYHVPEGPGTRGGGHPDVDSPNGGYDGFPERYHARRRLQELLRAEALQPLRALALRPGLPGGRDLREPRRRGAGGQDLLPRLPLLRAGLPLRLPLHRPADPHRRTSARLCYHRITKGLTTACCETCPTGGAHARRPEEPERPDPRVPARRTRSRCSSRRWRPGRRPTTTASTARCGREATMESILHAVEGFMYPNEVELQWSLLIVLYPFITGLVAGAFILASLERVFNVAGGQADLPPGAADRARLPAGRAAAAAAPPRPPRALARDVPDAAHHLGHGDVRLRLPLVPAGRAGARDLARLPAGDRADAPGRAAG